ncbi:MAG TPA: hypothetical protein VFV38_50950 [Ktedonobacteraceae bacterium]|nr:hypothetical protein [Ktedonobacteraceae bacterium]
MAVLAERKECEREEWAFRTGDLLKLLTSHVQIVLAFALRLIRAYLWLILQSSVSF